MKEAVPSIVHGNARIGSAVAGNGSREPGEHDVETRFPSSGGMGSSGGHFSSTASLLVLGSFRRRFRHPFSKGPFLRELWLRKRASRSREV